MLPLLMHVWRKFNNYGAINKWLTVKSRVKQWVWKEEST